MSGLIGQSIIEYEPERERSKDMDYNKEVPCIQKGYIKDDRDFYSAGEYERKDAYGQVVTHQDSRSLPTRRGYDSF